MHAADGLIDCRGRDARRLHGSVQSELRLLRCLRVSIAPLSAGPLLLRTRTCLLSAPLRHAPNRNYYGTFYGFTPTHSYYGNFGPQITFTFPSSGYP
jgi:hypothetical protein